MTITTLSQSLHLSQVDNIVVTDPSLDPLTGAMVREVRVFSSGIEAVPAMTLRLAASDAEGAGIKITVPNGVSF